MTQNQTPLFPLARNRNDEIKALDQLFLSSRKYRVSENYLELLQFINRFPALSPFNSFLIHMQHPGAQFVATETVWRQKYFREPVRDARPLVILIPFGPVEFVYEVNDTEGQDLPEEIMRPFVAEGNLPAECFEKTLKNSMRDGVKVYETDFGDGMGGYAKRKLGNFSISLNKKHVEEVRYASLAHELGHIYAGHLGTTEQTWWPDRDRLEKPVKEIEAESISFLVCRRLGIQTNAEEYLVHYVTNHEEVPLFSLDIVLTVAGYIEQMGRQIMKPRKPEDVKKRRAWNNHP